MYMYRNFIPATRYANPGMLDLTEDRSKILWRNKAVERIESIKGAVRMFNVGDCIIYSAHGVCRIDEICE